MTFEYSLERNPPALIISLQVADLGLRKKDRVDARIDTGAGISALPHEWRERLELRHGGTVFAHGPFDGSARQCQAWYIKLRLPLPDSSWQIQKVILTTEDHLLIGRDILNKYVLLADGPRLTFQMGKSLAEIETTASPDK